MTYSSYIQYPTSPSLSMYCCQFLHYDLCMAGFEDGRLQTVIQLEPEVGSEVWMKEGRLDQSKSFR